ncbi:DHHC palmitoyltransferase family protein [Brugia pahangi]
MQYKQNRLHCDGVINHMDMFEDFTGRLREILPSETQDRIAMFILFILLPLGFLFEIFAILPTEHEVMSKGWNLRVGILMLFGLNAFANVYKVISVGPNGNCSDLPAVQKHGYRFCYNCQLNEPPRSHHCPVCDRCVFRRDHHSSFVAVCVGHFNQRYYISAICSLWIISLTVLMWNWSFMWTSLGGFSPLQLWELIVPHLALIFRIISFSQFLCVMTFIFSFTVFVFLCYLITAQLFCLYRGQTRVEYLMDVHAYNLGFMENVRQAMGRRWFIALLMPFISSPLDSDGLSYPTRESKPLNDMKTM